MRFDLVDLRLFLHIAEMGSITHGAERANLALPSASGRVKAMEEALGVALLDRKRHGISLTAAGRALHDHARLILQQVERMRGDLGAHARGLRGQIRLQSNTAALTEHLPPLLAGFLAEHPSIDIELEERESSAILDALVNGIADIGIVANAPDDWPIDRHEFADDRLVVVMPQHHPLATRRRIAFREVTDLDFVGLNQGSALQAHIARQAARLGQIMRFRVRLPGSDAICRMVESGVGIAILPATAARRCRRSMAIAHVALSDPWALRRLSVCVASAARLPSHAKLLLGHLTRGV
jgi:molybdate transport repressor ModE-like protein